MQGLSHVLASLDLALQLGLPSVKVNTVLMKGRCGARGEGGGSALAHARCVAGFNDDEICDFVELTRERPIDVRCVATATAWRRPRAAPNPPRQWPA